MRKLLLTLLLLISGCSSNAAFTANDQMFAAMMVPHHEQAIVMSELALKNSQNPKIIELANQIKTAQAPEIAEMKSWGGDLMGSHAGHQMAGMLSDDEITQLEQASGAAFDQLFLKGMIKHHQGAIEMAEIVISSKTVAAAKLGKQITETQLAEIEYMKDLLKSLDK